MRRNKAKDFDSPPKSLLDAKGEMERIAIEQDLKAISENIYKGEKDEVTDSADPYFKEQEYEVRYLLRKLYGNKCAYCESIEYKPDVEHYRPKKKVTDISDSKGYYWLCYEWSNLIPACNKCNSGEGKWNKFPVMGQRVTQPPIEHNRLVFEKCKADDIELKNEKAGILHPEVDSPEIHFSIEPDGKLKSIEGEGSIGQATIDICDLNRGNLRYNRKLIFETIKNNFTTVFVDFRKGVITIDYLSPKIREVLRDLLGKSSPSEPFSFVAFYVLIHFEDFVINNLSELAGVEQTFLIKEYEKFKK